jgi:hypothetical protein
MSSRVSVSPAVEVLSAEKTAWQKPVFATLDTWEAAADDSSGNDGGLVS